MFFIRNQKFKAKKLENEVMIFDASENKIITLNSSGKLIWTHVWKKRTNEEIFRYLAKNYKVSEASIIGDVEKFLKQAVKSKIIIKSKI